VNLSTYHDYPLAPLSWFRTGGSADTFIKADTLEELQKFMEDAHTFNILGNGSNTLIRDGGVAEPVLKLGRGFRSMTQNSNQVTVGAACLNRTVVEQAATWGLSGLEFLTGIPGSIGGAVAMNAGACGCETKDVLQSIQICLPGGNLKILDVDALAMNYRHTLLPEGAVVTSATFSLIPTDATVIRQRINTYLEHRDTAQPIGGKTGGSTFKNPNECKAWELIDAVGLRGYRIGGAAFSEKHCNFIMNTDGSASDIEDLGNLAQTRVREKTGIELEWEIKRVGRP
jgi:UDP-N-acetylmuramate dehydrogenase